MVQVYHYAGGLDDSISRLSSIADSSNTLEAYSYLGLGTVVRRAHPVPGMDLTYIKLPSQPVGDAGDQYRGLDRFGRVVEQVWRNALDQALDELHYTYDRDSNRTSRLNILNSDFDEFYEYDMLNQLIDFSRTNGRSQSWDMDGQGNFETVTTDGTPENRTHNAQNQLTQVGSSTLTFDANGNMTTDEVGRRFRYDAWNRIVGATDSEDNPIIDFSYDALNRRIQEIRPSETRDLFYSTDWQLLEEQVNNVAVAHYVWSPVYVDALVLRDGADSGDPQPVLYAMQDANFNVTGIVSTASVVLERYVQDPYGQFTVLTPVWTTLPGSLYSWNVHHQGLRFVFDVQLYHGRGREFFPTPQRWLQEDLFWMPNLYVGYANNPGNNLDPSGLLLLQAPPVKINPVDGPVGGLCGTFWWTVNFTVTAAVDPKVGGVIIQHVVIDFSQITYCNGKPFRKVIQDPQLKISLPADMKLEYWEAWEVLPMAATPGPPNYQTALTPAEAQGINQRSGMKVAIAAFNDVFGWTAPIGDYVNGQYVTPTKGKVSYEAEVYYVDKVTIAQLMRDGYQRDNRLTGAGRLPALSARQGKELVGKTETLLQGRPSVKHTLAATWNCCGDCGKIKGDVTQVSTKP